MKKKRKPEPPIPCPKCGLAEYGYTEIRKDFRMIREVCIKCDASKRYHVCGWKGEVRV